MPKLIPFLMVLSLVTLAGGLSSQEAKDTPESLLQKSRAVLARIDGTLDVPGLKAPVEVLRDEWGVPHIYAKNQDDLFFAQGFVVAQDRLFQMDMWRRVGVGETAEVLGRERLEGDRFARLLLYRGDMEAEWASYSPDAKQIAAAFTAGINACIAQAGDKLPIEFQVLGFKPKPWRPEDILGRMSGIIMIRNFPQEISRAQLIAAVGLEKARLIAPTDPPREFAPVKELDLNGIDQAVLAGYKTATAPFKFRLDADGSNDWVVDGTLSASGKPLLANDPHRALSLPALRYLVHLHAPGWDVIGSGEPGLPGVAIGHNDRFAWGFTIVGTDQADFYIEETHPDDPTRYKVEDRWEPMKVIKEKIRIRGEKDPVEVELRFTRHGPVLHQDAARHRAYALRWIGAEPGGAAYLGCLALDRARNWREFVTACKAWKLPAENIVYADVDGDIGWIAAGLTPVRKGWDGLLPVPGVGGQYEWQRFLAMEELPQNHNPPSHLVATANHNILPAGYRHEISYEWSPPFRFMRVQKELEAKKRFTLDDFKRLQHDNTSLPGQALVRVLKTVDLQEPALKPYVELLANWDGVLSQEARSGPLYAAWLQELLQEFWAAQAPKELLDYARSARGLEILLAALEKPEQVWFGPKPVETRNELMKKTLAAAVKKVQQPLGEDSRKWSWGRLHQATFSHPLADLGPEYAKAFNLGPAPRSGDAQTPNNTRHDEKFQQVHGASYRHLFDLADWDRGLATSVPGQSGQPGSPHYADLLPLWEKEEYFPLLFSRAKVEKHTWHRLVLRPGK